MTNCIVRCFLYLSLFEIKSYVQIYYLLILGFLCFSLEWCSIERCWRDACDQSYFEIIFTSIFSFFLCFVWIEFLFLALAISSDIQATIGRFFFIRSLFSINKSKFLDYKWWHWTMYEWIVQWILLEIAKDNVNNIKLDTLINDSIHISNQHLFILFFDNLRSASNHFTRYI